MRGSVTIGEVRDIPLRLHWTFLLILPVFAYFMGRFYFATDPGEFMPGWVAFAWGGLLAVFLFGTVLLHELGHSLTALREGVNIRHITLLPIGGVSAFEDQPRDPDAELKITAMGPVVNFVIGIPLLALAWALLGDQTLSVLAGTEETRATLSDPMKFLVWAGFLNVFLGAFNMFLPAFPMDGGRLLRATLAKRMGLRRATSIAATVGRGLAFLMALFGFFAGSILLIIIAFFVWVGAGEEQRSVNVTVTLGDHTVADLMTPNPDTVSLEATVAEVFDRMMETKHLAFPVTDRDRPVGTVHLTDLARVRPEEHEAMLVRDVYRHEYPEMRPEAQATDALALISREDETQPILVIDAEDQLVGILTRTDLVRAVQILSAEHPQGQPEPPTRVQPGSGI